MEKLNIAELLKDCPKGTKLYSPLVGECRLEHIHGELKKILISASDGTTLTFNYNGTYFQMDNSECLLFPSKDQRDWSKFQRPFKDGDIIFTHANCLKVRLGNTWISIYQEKRNGGVATYVDYAEDGSDYYSNIDGDKAFLCMEKDILRQRLATEEEKAKLFDAIKANGYKWNSETKTLEKLSKFKVGDRIILKDNPHNIPSIRIKAVTKSQYILENEGFFYIDSTDEKYVLEDKFDINTLKPFDKVLVRCSSLEKWHIQFFEKYNTDSSTKFPFICLCYNKYSQCIPYEENKHLLDTTNNCDEYYKTW